MGFWNLEIFLTRMSLIQEIRDYLSKVVDKKSTKANSEPINKSQSHVSWHYSGSSSGSKSSSGDSSGSKDGCFVVIIAMVLTLTGVAFAYIYREIPEHRQRRELLEKCDAKLKKLQIRRDDQEALKLKIGILQNTIRLLSRQIDRSFYRRIAKTIVTLSWATIAIECILRTELYLIWAVEICLFSLLCFALAYLVIHCWVQKYQIYELEAALAEGCIMKIDKLLALEGAQ